MLVNLDQVLKPAKAGHYAVGLFNTHDTDMLEAAISAAEELKSPIIIGTAEVLLPYGDLPLISPALVAAAKRASVPVVVHYDHGLTFEKTMEALKEGFSSVMYDASAKDYETNVAETAEVTKIAHAFGATIEGEIGHVGLAQDGDDKNGMYTTVEEAVDFQTKTGVDALAVAVGNAHGVYKTKPCIQLEGTSSLWRAALDPAPFAGKTIWLECDYKLEGVSANPEKKNTHGFIVRLVCKRSNGKTIYFHKTPLTGTTDWKSSSYKIVIPEDTVSMVIGIQTPDGTALVRRLALVLPAVKVSSPLQRQSLSPLTKKPVIDGILAPGEWAECAADHNFISGATAQKVKRDVFVYYGYDRDNFYFCQLCSIPAKPQTLAADDTLEVTLLSPDKKKTPVLRFS